MSTNAIKIYEQGGPEVMKFEKIDLARKRYDIKFNQFSIAIIHPVTTNLKNLKRESEIFFSALKKLTIKELSSPKKLW